MKMFSNWFRGNEVWIHRRFWIGEKAGGGNRKEFWFCMN